MGIIDAMVPITNLAYRNSVHRVTATGHSFSALRAPVARLAGRKKGAEPDSFEVCS